MNRFEIDTTDQTFVDSLQKDTPEGIKVYSIRRLLAAAVPPGSGDIGGELLGVAIEIVTHPLVKDVFVGIISAWLYDKFVKSGSNKITINRIETDITKGNITKIIEETIQIEE